MPFVGVKGAATGSFFFFGLRISRVLRFWPLAIISSSKLVWHGVVQNGGLQQRL
jgi:hypothetical protein